MNPVFSQNDLAVLLFLRRNPHYTVSYIHSGIHGYDVRTIESTMTLLERRGHLLFMGGGSSKRYQLKPATVKALTMEPAVVLTANQLGAVRARLQSRQAWNAARLDEQDKVHYIAVDRLCEQTQTTFAVCRAALMQLETEGVVLKVDPPSTTTATIKRSPSTPTVSTTKVDGDDRSPTKQRVRDTVDKPRVLFTPWEAWARKTSWILVNLPYCAPVAQEPHTYLSHEARAIAQYCKQHSVHEHMYLADRYETLGHDATATFNNSECQVLLCAMLEGVHRHMAREKDHLVGILNAEISKLHDVVARKHCSGDDEKEFPLAASDVVNIVKSIVVDDAGEDNNHTALMILRAVDVIRDSQLEDVSLSVLLQNVSNRALYRDDIWEQALSVLQD